MTNTIDNNQPATEADPPLRAAFETQPGLAVPLTVSAPPGLASPVAGPAPTDLESRIMERRAELIAKLVELRADNQIEATGARDKLKAKLSELAHIIKEGVVDGWPSIGDVAKRRLDHWLTS